MTNKNGGKMYIQDKVEEYSDEVFQRMDKGAHMYFCGLKVNNQDHQPSLTRTILPSLPITRILTYLCNHNTYNLLFIFHLYLRPSQYLFFSPSHFFLFLILASIYLSLLPSHHYLSMFTCVSGYDAWHLGNVRRCVRQERHQLA